MTNPQQEIQAILRQLGIKSLNPAYSTGVEWANVGNREIRQIFSPINSEPIASVEMANSQDYEAVIKKAQEAFAVWQKNSCPQKRRNRKANWR
jgi:aldehyde dehydrogenase (NAD+)